MGGHEIGAVLAHADAVAIAAAVDMEGGDIVIIHALILNGYIGCLLYTSDAADE